jgi:hypothetical protein
VTDPTDAETIAALRAKVGRQKTAMANVVAENERLQSLSQSFNRDWTSLRADLARVTAERDEARGVIEKLAGVRGAKITSGNELDWESVDKAAASITKQARDIAFCPPEALDVHRMRAGYVCDAIQQIAVALRLRPAAVDSMVRAIEEAEAQTAERIASWLGDQYDLESIADDIRAGAWKETP